MPSLRASSESSGNEDSADCGFSDDESGYDESSYDADEEEEFHGLLRAAMEKVHDSARLGTSSNSLVRGDGDRGNPFIKLLGSLGGDVSSVHSRLSCSSALGRLFSSNPKLRVERSEAKKPGTVSNMQLVLNLKF